VPGRAHAHACTRNICCPPSGRFGKEQSHYWITSHHVTMPESSSDGESALPCAWALLLGFWASGLLGDISVGSDVERAKMEASMKEGATEPAATGHHRITRGKTRLLGGIIADLVHTGRIASGPESRARGHGLPLRTHGPQGHGPRSTVPRDCNGHGQASRRHRPTNQR